VYAAYSANTAQVAGIIYQNTEKDHGEIRVFY
jgi:hypothetical protein